MSQYTWSGHQDQVTGGVLGDVIVISVKMILAQAATNAKIKYVATAR